MPLTLRLIFSLAVVVGLLLLLARLGAKRFAGGPEALVQVVHRQALSRTSAISVVTVGSKVLVLGSTDQQVTLLTELDPEELVSDELIDEAWTNELGDPSAPTAPSPRVGPPGHRRGSAPSIQGGALGGSLLSAATWKQAWAAVTTVRKTP